MEYDSEFVHRHPDVAQRQHMLWEAKFQQLSKVGLDICLVDIHACQIFSRRLLRFNQEIKQYLVSNQVKKLMIGL